GGGGHSRRADQVAGQLQCPEHGAGDAGRAGPVAAHGRDRARAQCAGGQGPAVLETRAMSDADGNKVKRLRVTLTKSPIGCRYNEKRTVEALGLRRLHQTIEHEDTPIVRGMIAKVRYLVTVEDVD